MSTSAVGTLGQVLRAVEILRQKSGLPETDAAPRSEPRMRAVKTEGALSEGAMGRGLWLLPFCLVPPVSWLGGGSRLEETESEGLTRVSYNPMLPNATWFSVGCGLLLIEGRVP